MIYATITNVKKKFLLEFCKYVKLSSIFLTFNDGQNI